MKGDAGTVGRLRVNNGRLVLDLNGKRLKGRLYPSVTCMVVQIGKTEAKVGAVTDEVCVVTEQEDTLQRLEGSLRLSQETQEDD